MGMNKIVIIDSAKEIALNDCYDDQACWVDDSTDERMNPIVNIAELV